MPNWTYNKLTIKGRPQSLQRLHKLVKSDESCFTFDKVIPCPEALKSDDWQNNEKVSNDNIKKYGYAGWYDWRIANWDTKWEAANARFENGLKGVLTYHFDTAWSPPEAVIRELARRFPSLEFTHEAHEEAQMFDSFIKTYHIGGGVSERIIDSIYAEEESEDA